MSGNSWANMGQECIKCHINVYPHKQVRGGVQGAGGSGEQGRVRSRRRGRGAVGCTQGPSSGTDRGGLPFPLLSPSLLLHTMGMRPHLSK